MNIYPWQQSQWQYVCARRSNDTLPHALLLTGPQGMGKLEFAKTFAVSLLCTNVKNDIACGSCSSCHFIQAGTHPDFFIIQPEATAKMLKIDQIRQLIEQLQQTSQQTGYQVVIIEPAELLNVAAANALLKILEEPPGKILFLLVSHQPSSLPMTVRSRCQQLIFTPTDEIGIRNWLEKQISAEQNLELLMALAEKVPLKALKLAKTDLLQQQQKIIQDLIQICTGNADPIKTAANYNKTELKTILNILATLLADLIKIKLIHQPTSLTHQDKITTLKQLAANFSTTNLIQLQDKLLENNLLLSKNINLNQQLLLENLFMQWGAGYVN